MRGDFCGECVRIALAALSAVRGEGLHTLSTHPHIDWGVRTHITTCGQYHRGLDNEGQTDNRKAHKHGIHHSSTRSITGDTRTRPPRVRGIS